MPTDVIKRARDGLAGAHGDLDLPPARLLQVAVQVAQVGTKALALALQDGDKTPDNIVS